MRFSQILTGLVAVQVISAASIPESNALIVLEDRRVVPASELVSPDHTLERRKGGGGRGGGSSGGGSSGGGRSGGSSGGAPGRTSTTSNAGGSSSAGSGRPRSFAGGKYYGGGAATPYTAGSRTPKGLIAGALILPAAMLLIMPGLWIHSTYPYYYNNPYRFRNQSANATNNDDDNNNDRRALWTRQTQGANETLPVLCVCEADFVCGCDENDDQQYINDLIGNGSYAALNKSLVTVSDINGTKTLVLNGTLEKGTTAPGGSDDDDSAAISSKVGKYAGYYAVGLMVFVGVFM